MINIDELKKFVEFVANKHQSGASLTPADFNTAVQSALDDMLLYYYGLPQHYAPGNPMPAVAWEVTQLVTDYLSGLKENPVLAIDTDGKMTLPADYLHKSSILYEYIVQSDACDEDERIKCKLVEPACDESHGELGGGAAAGNEGYLEEEDTNYILQEDAGKVKLP